MTQTFQTIRINKYELKEEYNKI